MKTKPLCLRRVYDENIEYLNSAGFWGDAENAYSFNSLTSLVGAVADSARAEYQACPVYSVCAITIPKQQTNIKLL